MGPIAGRGPVPLWKFGRAGWAGTVLGSALLAAQAAGLEPFYRVMVWTTDLTGWTLMTRLLIGLYMALDRFGAWYELQGPAAGTHPLFYAGLAAGLLASEARGRWWRWWAAAAVGVVARAWPAAWPEAYQACRTALAPWVGGETVIVIWLASPMVVAAWAAGRSWRSWGAAAWVLVFMGAAVAVNLVEAYPGLRTDPWVPRVMPLMRWGWLVGWWVWVMRRGFAERVRRFPRVGFCPRCGYDLAGLGGVAGGPGGVGEAGGWCPECGSAEPSGLGPAPPTAAAGVPVQQPCSNATTKSS